MSYVVIEKETGEQLFELEETDVQRFFGATIKQLSSVKMKYPFIKINYKLIAEYNLTPSELKAFLVLCKHIQPKTNIIMKNGKPFLKKDLQKELKTSPQMARRYFNNLQKDELIKKNEFDKTYWVVNPYVCCKSEYIYKNIVDLFGGGEDETHSI